MTKSSIKPKKTTKPSIKITVKILESSLKEFELAYNLAPELSKSQIKKLKSEFEKIFKLDYSL